MGVDGATFDVMIPLLDAGKMPNFASLMGKGASCNLRSTVPILSPVAWTTFSTGVNPGRHGIFNFLKRKDDAYEIIASSSSQRRIKPFWKVAGDSGKRVAILNVPATYPPDRVNGFMIAGDPTPFHDERRVYPSGTYRELEAKFGTNFLKPAPPFRREHTFLNGLLKSVELWTDIAKHAIKNQDWDLAVVVYTATDTVQHFFWSAMDASHPSYSEKSAARFGSAILSVYEKIDWAMGELLPLVDDRTNIVVLSDHGFGPLNRSVPLTKWLVENGYLSYLPGRQNKRQAGIQNTLRFILSRLGLTEGLPPIGTLRNVDWAKTKAYYLGVSGDLYINLKGREPRGIVEPGREYDALVDLIARKLKEMKLPDGSSPVEAVSTSRERYPGSIGAPDILIQWARGFDLIKEGEPDNLLNGLRSRSGNRWSGTHLENGILILSGPAIRESTLTEAAIEDVAPTVYHLLGLPVPRMVDGNVLTQALTDESRRSLTRADIDITETGSSSVSLSGSDAGKIAESLKNLGYLD